MSRLKHNRTPEIAAPAGDISMLTAAVRCGADAIYLGLKQFSARAFADNFTSQELHHTVGYCHARGVRVFVALNTLLYNNELPQLVDAIKDIAAAGADAIIVQDMAVMRIVKNICPTLAVHASTQCSALTAGAVKFLGNNGFKRVVIGRESGISDIADAVKTGVELEVFVHGALCYCVSGSCYMSAFLGGRSANRGRCASPCRLPYSVQGRAGRSLLSLRDLCNLDLLPELHDAGVASVKIEGRMRTPEYVAAAVDAAYKGREGELFDRDMLMTAFSHGGFTNGYYYGYPDKEIFGARTDKDAKLTKAILPTLRALYRSERQSVGVDLKLKLTHNTLTIEISCDDMAVKETVGVTTEYTERPQEQAVTKALCKLGGTPFYCKNVTVELAENVYLPSGEVATLRRELALRLLERKEIVQPHRINEYLLPAAVVRSRKDEKKIRVRIADVEQLSMLSDDVFEHIEQIVIPAEHAPKLAPKFVTRAILEYARGDSDDNLCRLYKEATGLGFKKHMVDNPSHFMLGDNAHGGFALNITNRISAEFYLSQGLSDIILSVELPAADTKGIDGVTGVIGYGHLPLMLSAALPDGDIDSGIIDRKSRRLSTTRRNNFIEIHNAVPLYVGDRQQEFFVDFFMLYFTEETPQRVAQVIDMFRGGMPYDSEFTRGLYY